MIELYENYSSAPETIIPFLDTYQWDTSLKRRTQQYGFHYDFRHKSCVITQPIPSFLQFNFRGINFNQCIVNEYVGKQGIAAHIDNSCFGPVIVIYSLGDSCTMRFRRGVESKNYVLPSNSLLVLSGEDRYDWTHTIKPSAAEYHLNNELKEVNHNLF